MSFRATVILVVVAFIAPASGGTLTVQVGDALLAPNGSGVVNVTVTGAGEQVSLAGYEFRITPVAGTTSQLRFLEESESFLNSGSYLFAGNSAARDDAVPSSVGAVSTTTLPADTFVGGDSASDAADVALSGQLLLVRLLVAHDAGPVDPATTFGHSFLVSLVPSSGDSSGLALGTSNTGLLDSSFAGVAYDSAPGTVTVAIPEPSTLVLLLLSLVAIRLVR
jgi:hypothetical protein